MSLARRVSLLFGAAVLLTICATLAFPWLQMTALNRQAMLLQAQRVAFAAYRAVDLYDADWLELQRQLERIWPLHAAELGLPPQCPMLVPITPDVWKGHGFHREAAERLGRMPAQQYYWRMQDGGQLFRFALAVRGVDSDPYPHLLRGLIDVKLQVPRERDQWNMATTALAGAGGAVLAIMVFYFVTQRLVLRPVNDLRAVTEKVTAGDIEVRSLIRSGDEFEDLSNALNKMLAYLREAQEQQRTINRSLDIRLGELAEANVALYESNRLKSEFLANVSHELRTPLVSIIGFAELLRDSWGAAQTDASRLQRYADNILTSGRSLLEIINDLLDLAKIEAGKLELHVSDFSLAELGTDLVDFVRPLADKRNQKITLFIDPELPRLQSDSGKIKQILYNLLSNAVKFTPPEGSISVRIESTVLQDSHLASEKGGPAIADCVRMTIADTGPGIPTEHHASIFEKFRQLDSSKTREHEGTGLGLAITKELVHILGGTLTLQSREGEGATFIVELPLNSPNAAALPRINLT